MIIYVFEDLRKSPTFLRAGIRNDVVTEQVLRSSHARSSRQALPLLRPLPLLQRWPPITAA
eukprot:COSAG01_NODE_4406_length_5056_cov_124.577365_8_plen_61_part_00